MKKIVSIILLVVLGATLSIGVISYVRGGLVYSWFNPETEIEDTKKDKTNKDIVIDENTSSISLLEGETFTFNVMNNVPFKDSDINVNDLNISLTGVGSVILASYYRYYNGAEQWWEDTDVETTLESIKDNIITMSYENGVAVVTVNKSISSYYESLSRLDGGRTTKYEGKFRKYVGNPSDCFYLLSVTCEGSDLSRQIKININ